MSLLPTSALSPFLSCPCSPARMVSRSAASVLHLDHYLARPHGPAGDSDGLRLRGRQRCKPAANRPDAQVAKFLHGETPTKECHRHTLPGGATCLFHRLRRLDSNRWPTGKIASTASSHRYHWMGTYCPRPLAAQRLSAPDGSLWPKWRIFRRRRMFRWIPKQFIDSRGGLLFVLASRISRTDVGNTGLYNTRSRRGRDKMAAILPPSCLVVRQGTESSSTFAFQSHSETKRSPLLMAIRCTKMVPLS